MFCLLDGPAKMALEGLALDELSAPDGAERVFQCLDARFPDLEAHEKTAAYTGRGREIFEKAAREGIAYPEVARRYLMLRGARLEPERKAIVVAAAGQSHAQQNNAFALRATSPHNVATTKEFVHVLDESEELTEETDVSVEPGAEDEELDDVVSEFHRASQEGNMVIEEEEAVCTLVSWKESRRNVSSTRLDRHFSPRAAP